MAIALAILAAATLAIVQGSFFEWTFHRYWLHRPWLPEGCFTGHTLIHHQLCKFEDTFHVVEEEQHEALSFSWWGGPALVIINLIPWALLSWGLAAAGVSLPYLTFLIAFSVVVLLYYVAYEGLHYLMHKPTIPMIENSGVFQFIKRHHRIHHIHMDKNLNVLVPIADFMLGSLVLKEPADPPRVTPPTARKVARRHSRFGRKLIETQDRAAAPSPTSSEAPEHTG